MRKVVSLLLLLSISTFGFIACKKKTGPQGETGPQGPKGSTGNANVSSTTFTVSTWTLASSGSVYVSNYISAPQLDSVALTSGAVLCYFINSSYLYPIPFTDGDVTLQQAYGLHYMQLFFYNNDHTAPSNPGTVLVRLVVVPPALKAAYPHLNTKNYQEVKRAFHLDD